MTTQIDEYCDFLRRRGRKESTIGSYRSSLEMSIKTLEKGRLETDANKIGENEIYYLIQTLNVSEPTAQTYIMLLKGMVQYYTGKDIVKPMALLWNRPQRRRVFIEIEDFVKMYEIATPKERMILVLGAFMGLRRDEIQHITLQDIKRRSITIHGKGHGKNGLVIDQPMPDEVKEEIDRYMVWRRSLVGIDVSHDRLIVCYDERKQVISYYSDRSGQISKIVHQLGERAGVECTCHSLRRLFCTTLYYGINGQKGCDLVTLKELMRHSSINTTVQCYIDVKDKEKEKVICNHSAEMSHLLNRTKHISYVQSDC